MGSFHGMANVDISNQILSIRIPHDMAFRTIHVIVTRHGWEYTPIRSQMSNFLMLVCHHKRRDNNRMFPSCDCSRFDSFDSFCPRSGHQGYLNLYLLTVVVMVLRVWIDNILNSNVQKNILISILSSITGIKHKVVDSIAVVVICDFAIVWLSYNIWDRYNIRWWD